MGALGGRFSLGRLEKGSGDCVGIVVESRVDVGKSGHDNGLGNTWIIGESFFRDVQVTFEVSILLGRDFGGWLMFGSGERNVLV
jgi:hypothetical protein